MMILNYNSKKELKENIGNSLVYTETSIFGNEYRKDRTFVGSNRPFLPEGTGNREFFAEVTMKDNLIYNVK